MVVAIDGPAGVGKSSVSRETARKTGLHYLNSGNFYRAVTFAAVEAGVDRTDAEAVTALAGAMDLDYRGDALVLDGRDITDELHGDAVDAEVAQVSAFRGVREYVNDWLRRVAGDTDIVVEGRDITTVVFPDAELKSSSTRAPKCAPNAASGRG